MSTLKPSIHKKHIQKYRKLVLTTRLVIKAVYLKSTNAVMCQLKIYESTCGDALLESMLSNAEDLD